MRKHIPNAITCSRYLFALGVLLSAIARSWELAFWLLVAGGLTDFLDGWLATKLDAKSELGRDYLDWSADACLVHAALIGLCVTDHLAWWIYGALIVANMVPHFIANMTNSKETHYQLWLRCKQILPLYVFFGVPLLVTEYAGLAYDVPFWVVVPVCIIEYMAINGIKPQRIEAWRVGEA